MTTKITVKAGLTGRTFKTEEIAFYFRDDSGFEHYAGQVAFIGDYAYIPSMYRVTKEKDGSLRVIRE